MRGNHLAYAATQGIKGIPLSCLTSVDNSKHIQKIISVNHEGLTTPITFTVVIIVAGRKMHMRQEVHWRITNLSSEESLPVHDGSLGTEQ